MRAAIDTGEFKRGWPELFAAMLGNASGVGAVMYYSMSSFMLPLEREFGWSRSDTGLRRKFAWCLVGLSVCLRSE